jgi:CHAT domain-containing protein
MRSRLLRSRAARRSIALVALLALPAAPGCSLLSSVGSRVGVQPPTLAGALSGNLGLDSVVDAHVSPEAKALLVAAGPLAVQAMGEVIAALERHLAERRAAEAKEQERQQLLMSSAQIFYAKECSRGAAAGAAADASLERQADDAFAAADYATAAVALKQAREARAKQAGENSPEVARLLNREAAVQLALGDYPQAMPPAMRALKIRQDLAQAAGSNKADKAAQMTAALDLAESLTTVGQVYRAAGVLDSAAVNLQQALAQRSQHLGAEHLCVAQAETNLGELKLLVGSYKSSFELFAHALATRQKKGATDRDVAQSFNDLGLLYKTLAAYTDAETYYKKALANRQKLGADHPEVADSLQNLGALYKARGDFVPAEDHYNRALEIRRKRLGDGLDVAQSQNALAELYFAVGDYAQAETRLQSALAIRRAKLPANHPELGESLESLARLQQAKGDLAGADRSYQEALKIWETKFGPEHPAAARTLSSLGELYVAQGRFDEAEARVARARTIREKALGTEHPDVAESIHELGIVAYAKRDYGKAEALFRAAADLRRRKLGGEHPELAVSLSYLAATLVALDRPDDAVKAFTEAQVISERLVRSVGVASSEARLDALLKFLRAQEEVVYSLLDDARTAPAATPLALAVALLRKGRSVDEAAGTSRALHGGLAAADQRKADELRMLRSEIAHKKLSPTGGDDDLPRAYARAEALEQELARTSAAFRAKHALPSLDEIVKQVAGKLGSDGALVEVLAYHGYAFRAKPQEPRWGDVRYAALVLDGKGGIGLAALGARQGVDDAVKRFLKRLTEAGTAANATAADDEARAGGQELERLVVAPLRPFLKASKRLVLSLDGQLNLVPFWALPDGKDFVIDKYELAYVTSGRDLLRPADEERSSSVALVARPEFVKGGAQGSDADASRGLEVIEDPTTKSLTPASSSTAARSSGRTALGSEALKLKAAPSSLAGTEQEARAIKKLLPNASIIMGQAATKDHLLGLKSPGILHVATHGLFRPDGGPSGRKARGLELVGGSELISSGAATAGGGDPLLNSMLLLANVGLPLPKEQGAGVALDPAGLATALEMAGMNLWGTQLVVLSACESGRGQVDNLGQGVYGLRRALVVAGAQTLVTSLWKVDDQVTRDLMVAYYKNLLGGAGRVEALRRAALLIRKTHPEPRFWAPFIAIGQNGPLKGIRGVE